MTYLFVLIAIIVGGALGLLLWTTHHRTSPVRESIDRLKEQSLTCRHAINLQYVRQIFESADVRYLRARVDPSVLRNIRKERHRVASKFLHALYEDFLRLEEVSSIVAAFSTEVDARQEWRRFLLTAEFRLKYAALRLKYAIGLATMDSFQDLAWMVSSLALEMDRTVNEIAAGAAVAQARRPSSQT